MFLPRILGLSLVLSAGVMLAGCGDDDAKSQAAPAAAAAAKSNSAQAEIIKYNSYVDAANSITSSFGEMLGKYEQYALPELKSGEPLKSFAVQTDGHVDRVKARLDKALEQDVTIAELDGPAKAFSEALGTLAPLSRELANYASSRAYMADNGALAREKSPAYVAALTEAAKTEAAFFRGMSEKDLANVKATFTAAEKDTFNYYRAGLVYYGKASLAEADGIFEGTGLGEQQAAFKQALDSMNEMALGYDKTGPKSDLSGCGSHINGYLAAGRTVLEHSADGTYAKPKGFALTSAMDSDGSRLRQNFSNMITTFNQRRC